MGDTLQMGHRTQDSPDRCSVVLESSASTVFYELPERTDKVIQVISRGATYLNAYDDAWAIYRALFPDGVPTRWGDFIWGDGTIWGGVTAPIGSMSIAAVAPSIDTYEAMTIVPLAAPQYIGQDKKLRFEFSVNFIFRIKKL
jgi:hypothetical protein